MTPEFSRSKDYRRISLGTADQDGHVRLTILDGDPPFAQVDRIDIHEDDFEWLIQSGGPAVLMALRRDRPGRD